MQSPLVRVIVTMLGGYIIILIIMVAVDWIREEYPSPPAEPPDLPRIQHLQDHRQAESALKRYSRLDDNQKDRMKRRLQSVLISVETWLAQLNTADCPVLCLGELHEEATRRFLADTFFTGYAVDVLMLEATAQKLRGLLKRAEGGRKYFPLLDADIMGILKTARTRNPRIRICGVEETKMQEQDPAGHIGSRDKAIARNFWNHYRPGMRHVILFGAMHCTNEPNWLFDNLRRQAPHPMKERMINVHVLGEHQNGALEAFVYFLDEIGVEKKNFVISDTRALLPSIYRWFPKLNRQTLSKYRTLLVFRT